jgi:mono/diheme cytochrome c family protein
MATVSRHLILAIAVLAIVASLVIVGFVWSGIYDAGADSIHSRPVYSMLQTLRERSITAHAGKLQPPANLNDMALIRQGAGNYDAMCTGCHLGPGIEPTELSRGLYPAPPNLSKAGEFVPSHHFWVIKHGIKASGMPAWGKSMGDEYIWGIVAFLQQLPKLDAARYRALVASSGGHSHGGGESDEHRHHDEGAEDHQHDGEAEHHHDDAMQPSSKPAR